MPRRERPPETQRSEHWLRVAANDHREMLNSRISAKFAWDASEKITWLSPVASDKYAEYFDQEFLDRLDVRQPKVALKEFWPRSGPRWDGLAKTESGKIILVEAKAYIEEAVDYGSRASRQPFEKIQRALASAKKAFEATEDAPWESPFYQYANRLAHLYFMRELNGLDAYLLFLCFADAPDVPNSCTAEQWQGAMRLTEKCLGITTTPFRRYVGTLIWSVREMLASTSFQPMPERGRG